MDTALTATAVRLAVNNLAALLEGQFQAVSGVEGKLEKLQCIISTIDEVLQNAESSPGTKNLFEKLKDVACDAEDVLDMFNTEAMRRSSGGQLFMTVRDFFSPHNRVLFRFKISSRIKAVITKLDLVLLEKSLLSNLTQDAAERLPRLEYHRQAHSQNSIPVVGRETEKETIVNMLLFHESSERISVIAIDGMAGLGKTTLAQLVFDDERVKDHFELPMWKVVGSDFNPTHLMESFLQLATRKEVHITEADLVRQELQKALSGKRFLLVLDDVWNEYEAVWEDLKAVLKYGATGSKVIVTTQSQKVSWIMGSSNPQHLQYLSDDHCLSLFQKFAEVGEECPNLVKIGKEIVKKCCGVPLAARALGSLLRFKRDEADWFSVLNSQIWELAEGENKILAALRLSYDHLSPRSKQCFEFCSLFPKNYEIEKENLIQLWVANSFISSQGSFDAETNGNNIFSDLLLRSFFQEGKKNSQGHITSCKMHDLMHDLARLVAGDECRILGVGYDEEKDIKKRTRHLFINQVSSSSISKALCKPQSLRTVLSLKDTFEVRRCIFVTESVHSKEEFKFLRILDLSGSHIMKVPVSVGNLIHLRYLNLSRTDIRVLPVSIGKLLHLMYLNLSKTSIEVLPESVGKLIHLRSLNLSKTKIRELPGSISLLQNLQYLNLSQSQLRGLPKNMGNMGSLKHLDTSGCLLWIHMPPGTGCSIRDLKDLKLHGQLDIVFDENWKVDSCTTQKILENKQDLHSLGLCWTPSRSVHNIENLLDDLRPHTSLNHLQIFNYGGLNFPTWLADSQIPKLVEVNLINCSCEHIPQFGNLQFLTSLRIDGMERVKRISAEFYGNGPVRGFPSLKQFSLRGMPNFQEWSGSEGLEIFPCLHTLTIEDCPKLKEMPWLPRIQHLKIYNCDGRLLSSVGTLTSLFSLDVMDRGVTSLPIGSFHNLVSLRELYITDCAELQSLPLDEMQHLTALQKMHLRDCINLGPLPEGLHNLTSLRSLKILGCLNVTMQPEVIMHSLNSSIPESEINICCEKVNLSGLLQHLQAPRLLRMYGRHLNSSVSEELIGTGSELIGTATLSICCCNEMGSLMEGPWASVLEDLVIEGWPSLTALPDWVGELRSIRCLRLCDCPELVCLPRWLQNLHALEHLWISKCPKLKRRFLKGVKVWQITSSVRRITLQISNK